jgi:NDP-sugar pyrophosphorylase family protein
VRTIALIMAGGGGSRMSASGVAVPKPLVPVSGISLLERNVSRLQRLGFDQIVVSVSARAASIRAFIADRLPQVSELVETEPLGNIGCAGQVDADVVLVVYADNLTDLDLNAIVEHHLADGAALTLAIHDESFRMPYGRVRVSNAGVVGYDEKPVLTVTVCSAVAVLGRRALRVLNGPMGLVDMTNALIKDGERVAAYPHQAPWVDVNDADAILRAETLIADGHAIFC